MPTKDVATLLPVAAVALGCLSAGVSAQNSQAPSLNMFGTTGLIDMPSAESQPDSELGFAVTSLARTTRTALTFQLHPRISGTFRYARIKNWRNGVNLFDRSFDVQFRVLNEGRYLPAVAIGLRDFLGTGVYSSQYLVATKNIGENVKVTAGLGWGRLSGSRNFQRINFGLGGKPNFKSWFRGDIGYFGGVEWQTPIKGLRFKAEYSPDKYVDENLVQKSPFNFGVSYTTARNMQFSAYYMHGSQIGLMFSTSLNPKRNRKLYRPQPQKAPIRVRIRPENSLNVLAPNSFAGPTGKQTNQQYSSRLQKVLDPRAVGIIYANYSDNSAELRIANRKFHLPGQAVEHTMRAMSQVLPDNIEQFSVVILENGLPISKVSTKRSDLETISTKPHLSFASIATVGAEGPLSDDSVLVQGVYPRVTSYLRPFIKPHMFDPDDPFRLDVRLGWNTVYNISPGFSISSEVSMKLLGNLDNNRRGSNSVIQRVRTDMDKYQRNSNFTIDRLTVDYLTKFSPDVYARFSGGFFETMYGGVSAEVLWKPTHSRLALGAEINWVKQRDFNQRLGFRDYSTVTGHVSAYWDMGNSYYAQVDVGRYLAKDWGATLTVERVFDNGWRIGAFATLTTVSFKDFGEGSFDKGIRITVPFAWLAGQPTRRRHRVVLRSITRDGGARVDVPNRLYELVSDADKHRIIRSW